MPLECMPVNARADKMRRDFDRVRELHVKQKLTGRVGSDLHAARDRRD
jgi:hypothetical protein